MTKLSVNINKIATLRNSRGGDLPNVVKAALDAERFGAQGITVHPRPDERHIRYADVRDIKRAIANDYDEAFAFMERLAAERGLVRRAERPADFLHETDDMQTE